MYVFPFVPGGINNWITLFFVASEDSMDRCRSVHKTKSERTAFINPRHWIQSPGNWHSGCQTWVDQDRWGSKNFTVFLFFCTCYLLFSVPRRISQCLSAESYITPPPPKKKSFTSCCSPFIEFITNSHYHKHRQRESRHCLNRYI